MKHKQKTPEQIKAELKWEKQCKYTLLGGRVGLIITLAILIDVFDFTEEEAHIFEDKYAELMNSYNEGNENPVEWMETLEKDYHLKLMSDILSMK